MRRCGIVFIMSDKMTEERVAFERMIKSCLGVYFSNNMRELITGQIRIKDDNQGKLVIYKVCDEGCSPTKYDIGIIY